MNDIYNGFFTSFINNNKLQRENNDCKLKTMGDTQFGNMFQRAGAAVVWTQYCSTDMKTFLLSRTTFLTHLSILMQHSGYSRNTFFSQCPQSRLWRRKLSTSKFCFIQLFVFIRNLTHTPGPCPPVLLSPSALAAGTRLS